MVRQLSELQRANELLKIMLQVNRCFNDYVAILVSSHLSKIVPRKLSLLRVEGQWLFGHLSIRHAFLVGQIKSAEVYPNS